MNSLRMWIWIEFECPGATHNKNVGVGVETTDVIVEITTNATQESIDTTAAQEVSVDTIVYLITGSSRKWSLVNLERRKAKILFLSCFWLVLIHTSIEITTTKIIISLAQIA